jgi:8-oxo-dGTP pyrophosphatase MutT (NUDIX family)
MKKPPPSNHSPLQPIEEAGAIAIRRTKEGTPEVLLILSKKKPRVRIFPKGHIEPGESAAVAARRELFEEAGITGRLINEAGKLLYGFKRKKYRVIYYLFQFETCIMSGEKGRDPRWYSPEEAYAILPFEGLRETLKVAVATAISKGSGI